MRRTSLKFLFIWNFMSMNDICGHPGNHVPSYLLRAHSDNISQFLHNEIDAFYTWFFKPRYLLFHYSLKGHVRREETNSDTCDNNQVF